MQRDYDWHSAHHLPDLESAQAVGARAGSRAVGRLDPGKAPVGKLPLIFDPRVGASLIGNLLGAIGGPEFARRTSFLLGKENEKLFDSRVVIRHEIGNRSSRERGGP